MAKKTEDALSAANVRKYTDEELGLLLPKTRQELYQLRAKAVTEKMEQTSEFARLRKGIARMLTERNVRRMAAQPSKKIKAKA